MSAQPRPLSGHDLDAFWMPFTANRQFKAKPRLLARAEGMHYWTDDGRQVLDAVAGLWCVNVGYSRPEIVEAVHDQMRRLPSYQINWPTVRDIMRDMEDKYLFLRRVAQKCLAHVTSEDVRKELHKLISHCDRKIDQCHSLGE